MSSDRNNTLLSALKNIVNLYNQGILLRTIQKNKVIAITAAITLSIAYFIHDRIFKPPKNLRHIPYLSYFGKLKSVCNNESISDYSHRVHLPLIESGKIKGLFMEISQEGWILHLVNPEDAKYVFSKPELFPKASLENKVKNMLANKFFVNKNIVMSNGAHWKSQRKIANPAFHRSMPVKSFGKLAQEMLKSMESKEEIIDASDLIRRCTLEAIGKIGFGFDFNAIHDKESEWISRYSYITNALRHYIYFLFPSFDSIFLWMIPERRKAHREMDIFLKMINEIIIHKREMIKNGVSNNALEENERDLLELMIENEGNGEGAMTNEELKNNLCIFLAAGHGTTASTLSSAIHYLAENQDIQQKAREEAISILGDEPCDMLPTVESIKNMVYINQIIKETLRINGPATRITTRISTEDTVLSNTFIPKGTMLTVNIFDIQHSNKLWKDADKFDPDRFAKSEESSSENMRWIPFGSGARQCIGLNFSMIEQKVILSMLLRKFTWFTPENSKHKNGLISTGIAIVGPADLNIAFHKRY